MVLKNNRRNEKCITSLCFFCLGHQGVDGVVLPSNTKRLFLLLRESIAYSPELPRSLVPGGGVAEPNILEI